MMEFWPEHQGQSPLYAKFGTVPGRNCSHNYHDRHQATHYPLYYGDQQDQGRESSYWTLPGSRTGGAPQDYTNWTDPELSVTTSSHFPFIVDRHTKQHQDLGEYQPHEARDREWTAAQRAAKEYERGFLREGWLRRWEPCSPARYNREVSLKRSDSSYRELEAWAARYSHSLPRRRRIEAELRGASEGLLESSRTPERDSRSGTDPRMAALQQVRQSSHIRESGVWDRGGRQQTLAYYPTQAPAPDTSHMLDIKEKTGYQRRMFSQPPGYIAPPPYNSPHKSSPIMHHCDISWEQDGKRQTYWSQPTLRKQDMSVDLQDNRKAEKEDFTKPDGNKTCAELDGLKHREPGLNALQASSPISDQNIHTQPECMSSFQQPQIIQAVQTTKTNEQMSSKVIEGRKFRLNKKTGGMTIFCLVSRIADNSETPSLPLCTSQTNIQTTELGEVSKGLSDGGDIYQTQKFADEVDFRAPALTEQSNTSDTINLKAKQPETPTCVDSEMLGDNISNKAETDVVSPEKTNLSNANFTFGRQVAPSVQPVSVKYPLWREPSFTSRAETESSSTVLKANSEEGESDGLHNREECATVDPINVEARRLNIKKDTKSEDSKGLLVIDTTCVVVKMELIPSPKKEHVHFIGSTPNTEDSPHDIQSSTCPESNSQLNQDETLNAEINPLQINERPESELKSDVGEKMAPEGGDDISFPCMPSCSISEKETLKQRAERILGIPLHDCIPEQQPEDTTSFLDSCVERQDVEVEPSPITNEIHDAAEQLPVDTAEEGSQNHFEVGQSEEAVHLKEIDGVEDEVKHQDDEDLAGPQEEVCNMSEEKDTDSGLETDIKMPQGTEIAEDILLEPTSDEGTTKQSQEENLPVENDTSSHHPPQCFSPPKDVSNSSLFSYSNPAALSYISQSNTEEGLDPNLAALDTAENVAPHSETSSPPGTPLQQLTSLLPPGSVKSSPSDTPHTHHSPSPLPPLDLMYQMADTSGTEDQDEGETSQLINNEISDAFADLEDQEVVSQEQFEYEQSNNAVCVGESNAIDEQQAKDVERDPTDLLEQTLETSQENAMDVSILHQQRECVQTEDVVCLKESYVTEDPLQQEASEDPTECLETTISQENMTDSQTQVEVIILQEQFDNGQEKDASTVNESHMTEEQSQIDADEDPAGLLEQTISKENATDCQTQIDTEILQDVEPKAEPSDSTSPSPSNSDYKVSESPSSVLSHPNFPSPPHASPKSDTEPVSFLETDSVCPSAISPVTADACIPEIVPTSLQLNSSEESLQFSSSSTSESAPNLAFSTSIPPHEGVEGVSLDLPNKEEPQYPKSLWDAVNRIRKHTAPDSENEEEEVSEQWDPESIGEDLGCPDMVLDMNSERIVFDEVGQHKVSIESVEDVEQDPCHEEPSRHVEDDTLSCSSISSSGDTVIIAEEDEVEETQPDSVTESKTESGELPMTEGEQCCFGEVKDETTAKKGAEDELDKVDKKELCLTEEYTAEDGNKTVEAIEVMEMEQKENEEEGLTPTEVAVVSDDITD